jgi:hypothetical protein
VKRSFEENAAGYAHAGWGSTLHSSIAKNGIYEEGILEKQVVRIGGGTILTVTLTDSKKVMVGAAALEPATLCLEDKCSSRLLEGIGFNFQPDWPA